MSKLSTIQNEIKAPKGQFNKFGNYKYRSCEDIVEAAKPVLNKYGFALTLTDEVVNIGSRFYVKATARIINGEETFTAEAWAREDETIKGMAGAQITGAASSYARKYALNGLFAIDDTKDADATNTHDKVEMVVKSEVDEVAGEDKLFLFQLLNSSDLTEDEKIKASDRINFCNSYEEFAKIQHRLEDRQQAFDTIPNPSATDVKRHLRKTVKA